MARTRNERLWMLGGGLGAVVVGLGAYTFVVSPKASQASDLRSQAEQVNAQNLALQDNLTRLQSDYAHLGGLKAARDHIRNALPTDNALSALTDQLAAEAQRSHVAISLLTTGAIAAVTPAATAAVPAATTSGTAAAPAPVAPPAAPAVAQGLYSIPVSLTVSGSSANDTAFLHGLQHAVPRASLVSSVVMNPAAVSGAASGGRPGVSMSVTFQVFVEAVPPTPTPVPVTPVSPDATQTTAAG